MIYEITQNNIDQIKDSFIDLDYMKNEFNHNPFAKMIILKENNKIIGYLYYSDIYDRAEINQIEIISIHRNCGKGSILMDYLTKNVDKSITLEVKEDNIAAIKLYEKYNFKKKAVRAGYYNGVDGILMERKKDSH